MKNKGFKIFLIICGALIVLGTALGAVGFALGGGESNIHIARGYNLGFGSLGHSGKTATDSQMLEPFTNVQMDAGLGEIKFMESDSFKISYSYAEKWGRPEISVKDGTLYVKDNPENKTVNVGISDFLHEGGNYDIYIYVYYPAGTDFGTVAIDANLGDVQLSHMTAALLDVTLDLGDLKISNVKAEKAVISLDLGDLDAAAFETGTLDVDGNMGEMDLSGTFKGQTNINGDMGDISVETSIGQEEYSYSVDGDMSDVSVNDQNYGNGHDVVNKGAAHALNVTCSMGDVEIDFGSVR